MDESGSTSHSKAMIFMFLPLCKTQVQPKQMRSDGALNGSEHRFSKGEDNKVHRAWHSKGSTGVLEQVLLLALCWKGFWKTSCSRKKSLSKAYVISYLCLFVKKLKLNGLCSLSSTETAVGLKWAQLEHVQLQIHVKQFPGKCVIKIICINSCFSGCVKRNAISRRGWL